MVSRKLIFLFSVIGIVIISHKIPGIVEEVYSHYIFPICSGSLQAFAALINIPLFVLFIAFVIYFILIQTVQKNEKSAAKFVNFLAVLITCFYFFWGFNYSRHTIEHKLNLNKYAIPDSIYSSLLLKSSDKLNELSSKINRGNDHKMNDTSFILNISTSVKRLMTSMGYKPPQSVVVKEFWPEGILLRFSTAGFYMPFTAECYYDGGLHPFQLPFVVAHECAHGYGIGDEGTCNFIAYLVCAQSQDPIIQYSGEIAYWKTIKMMNVNKSYNKENLLSQKSIQDLDAIALKMSQYPDIFPDFRDFIYNNFLKLQGISEGEANYNNFIDLIYKYKQN